MRHIYLLALSGLLILYIPGCMEKSGQDTWQLSSPDKAVRITVFNSKQGDHPETFLCYKVDYLKEGTEIPVLETSPLGIDRADQHFSENLQFISASDRLEFDEHYQMISGKQKGCRNHFNEFILNFRNQENSEVQLVLRAYNDGIAFRYVFPEDSDSMFTVINEETGFNIPDESKAWIQNYDVPTRWAPAYETFYTNGAPADTTAPGKEGWSFPALFHTGKVWMLVSEAGLDGTYCGMHLQPNPENGLYKLRFPEEAEGLGLGNIEPSHTLLWETPWRFIIIGESVGSIIESNMVYNLSKPSVIEDTGWIRPGKASWSWWAEPDSPKDFDRLVAYIDLAAEMNWEYSLVDANWNMMKGGDIKQLVDYANSKNVGILMWYNSGGPHNEVTEAPRDIMFDPETRVAEFKKLQEWGVKGVKIDFFQSDKPLQRRELL